MSFRRQPEPKFIRIFSAACLFMALALFLSITLRQFNLPGFYYDEALDLTPMLDLMGQGGTPLLRNIGVGPYPVMLLDYMGSLGGYLTVPFMKIFGVGWLAARAQPIFFSCVTIVLAWLLARRWFGGLTAGVMALLLAAQPSFIWFSRQGISVTSVMTVFSVGAALLVDVWREKTEGASVFRLPSSILLVLAGLLLGLGLWAKFLFFRWLLAFFVMEVVWVVLSARSASQQVGRSAPGARLRTWLAPRNLVWVLLGGVMGAAPLIYFNLVGLVRDGNPYTFGLLVDSLTKPTQQFGVNNHDFFRNLQKALDDVRVFVDGSYFWYNGVPFSNVYAVPALVGAVGLGILFVLFRRKTEDGGRAVSGLSPSVHFAQLLAALAVLTLMGAFTVSGQWATHQFIMVPWLQMVVAWAAVNGCWLLVNALVRRSQPTTNTQQKIQGVFVVLAAFAILALPFSQDLWVSEQHHQKLEETGGSGRFSDAIYKLADYFDSRSVAQPIALDWGIEKSVRVLTGNQVRPMEIFGYSKDPSPEFLTQAAELLKNPNNEYIVLWDRFAVYNRRKVFTDLANNMGKQVRETFIAHEKSGLPVYVVLKAE